MFDSQTEEGETLLVVDDLAENLAIISELLHPFYQVRAATSGEKALRIAISDPQPDLILLDVMMPDLDGYQVFERLRQDPKTCAIPVIFITAMDGAEAELRGLSVGAVDYVTKPVIPSVLLARVKLQLELKRARDRLADQNLWLESEVNRRMAENERIQTVTMRALAQLAEIRDPETGHHILRTQAYVRQLTESLSATGYPGLSHAEMMSVVRCAPLHDIGKIGVPDAILRKAGPLSAEEWVIMKSHAYMGAEAIRMAQLDTGQPVALLEMARVMACWHHERWDGSGYPDGLIGTAIPLPARLMAVADVFDALISPRVYKKAMTLDQARTIIAEGKGNHFDPDLVTLFLKEFDRFRDLATRFP
ncbi:MAG: response regulator [Magnetococcales bacterium]|nr:response regulator [Magnetococcales bacterium]MBF0260473.1 response regulator [Magnetococcales bacterium]